MSRYRRDKKEIKDIKDEWLSVMGDDDERRRFVGDWETLRAVAVCGDKETHALTCKCCGAFLVGKGLAPLG